MVDFISFILDEQKHKLIQEVNGYMLRESCRI
jgi:hypothetical protein